MDRNITDTGPDIKRRKLIKYGIRGAAMGLVSNVVSNVSEAQPAGKITRQSKNGKIVVVGAGTFGGWTALHLLRKGHEVTMVDQFGPGNNQSSSGSETRIIRASMEISKSILISHFVQFSYGRRMSH